MNGESYYESAREYLRTQELVDAEIDRWKRFSESAANEHRREQCQAKLRFLGKLRGEVMTPELFAS